MNMMNPADSGLNMPDKISVTVSENELEEIQQTAMLAPAMTDKEAEEFQHAVSEKGIDVLRDEMGEKQFLIKCFRAAAYFGEKQNPFHFPI